MHVLENLWETLALIILSACQCAAQQPSSLASNREALNDAWWTGPMLAPSASTLPRGHILIEPYLYDVITRGTYDSNGRRQSAPNANSFGSLTYALYGVANKFTVGMIPTAGYNYVSGGADSSGIGMGDLTLQAQYRLHLFEEGKWLPTTSIAVQETLPTGKFDHLGARTSGGFGSGAYTTTLAFFTQTYFWLPNGRIFRMRFNVLPAFSRTANVEDVSVYGTGEGFRGSAKPGSSVFVDWAGEYSLTRHWALAMDLTYRYQGNTSVKGHDVGNPAAPVYLNSGSSDAFGIAPAIEYNLSSRLGILLGLRLIPAGWNTADTITPAVAINYVH